MNDVAAACKQPSGDANDYASLKTAMENLRTKWWGEYHAYFRSNDPREAKVMKQTSDDTLKLISTVEAKIKAMERAA